MNNTPPEPVTPPARDPAAPDTVGDAIPSPTGGAGDIPQRIGDFRIVRVLGEGGMGTVYLAEDVRLGRQAAIKTMKLALAARPENRERFAREGRAAAAVEHDNIVPVWQVGEAADGSPFIAMPFLQGEMLEDRLRREPVQPAGVILKVAREVAYGLAAAHARGLIHRDIKPGNVWVEGDPRARDLASQVRRCKILDFGLARSVAAEDVQVTAVGAILGTPAYMAPEQAAGEAVDARADLFSLGALLYRMATGRLPFEGPNPMAVLLALARVTPPPARTRNPNLPPALSDLIDLLLSKDPAGRPQSAAEVAAAARRIGKELQPRKAPLAAAVPAEAPPLPAPAKTWSDIDAPGAAIPRPRNKPARGRTAVLVTLGLLALVPLGWWLAATLLRVETANGTLVVEINDPEAEARIRDGKLILTGPDGKVRYTLSPREHDRTIEAGPYHVHVEGADGLALDTPEFTLKKGGQVTVRVTVDPRALAQSPDPDRPASKWVLSLGGKVRVNGQIPEITAPADLPREAFRLTGITLTDNEQVTDAELARIEGCKSLDYIALDGTHVGDAALTHIKNPKILMGLGLQGTRVTDDGLATLKDVRHLHYLNLNATHVGDAALAPFKGSKDLEYLFLDGTQPTEEGLAAFKDCKLLRLLHLCGTNVTDEGLALFKDCKNLTNLCLGDTQVTNAGVAVFKDCKDLEVLFLSNTQAGDEGLAHFKHCKNLTQVNLFGSRVTDDGLASLEGCNSLKELNLGRTTVTNTRIKELKKALPQCKINWDGM
jgi:serine/threonine protein kinase